LPLTWRRARRAVSSTERDDDSAATFAASDREARPLVRARTNDRYLRAIQ
jgi:hypothetical protein